MSCNYLLHSTVRDSGIVISKAHIDHNLGILPSGLDILCDPTQAIDAAVE
jgi:hypothetical protein